MPNVETDVARTDSTEDEKARQEILDQLKATRASARRVLGSGATRRVSFSPDGTVMTPRDLIEDEDYRRTHVGHTDVDKDYTI